MRRSPNCAGEKARPSSMFPRASAAARFTVLKRRWVVERTFAWLGTSGRYGILLSAGGSPGRERESI